MTLHTPGRRQDLKDDELVSSFLKTWTYVQENSAKVFAGIAAVAGLVFLGVFLQNQATQKELAAIDLLGDVQLHVLNNENGEAILGAERIVDQYKDSQTADQALLILGNLYFDLNRTPEAQEAFRKRLARGHDGPGGFAAWSGLATTYEQAGNLAEAAGEYLKYAESQPGSAFAPMALSEAARCYRLAGYTAQSAQIYNRLINTHPLSTARQTAENELKLMGEGS
jgi:tetratricopeptide (TPR) repeat protein